MELISPFPEHSVGEAYLWHRYIPTCINGDDCSLPEFTSIIFNSLQDPGCLSWGVTDPLGSVVGMIVMTPIYRCRQLVDGGIHICFARRAWGQGNVEAVSRTCISQAFTSIPTLMRITAHTPSNYRPSCSALERVGFQREGTYREGAVIRGRLTDLAIYGLTRSDWMKG